MRQRRRQTITVGKIQPGWSVMKLSPDGLQRFQWDLSIFAPLKPNIIHCLPDMNVQVFIVEDLRNKSDILDKLNERPHETLFIEDFRKKYGESEGNIWGPRTKAECVEFFLKFDTIVNSITESIVSGVAIAREVQGIPIVDASTENNAKNIQRLATAVVETTELKRDPPEKEIADIDKILCCNLRQEFYTGNKGWLHFMYILCASVIAAAGLWLDSGPTVVAAMLVSSMMEPIKGMATVFKEDVQSVRSGSQRFLFHFITLIVDMCICIIVGAFAGWLARSEVWWEHSGRERFMLNGTEYSYTLLELMSGKNILGEGRKYVDDKVTVFLPGEMAGRTQSISLWGAVFVAFFSAIALIFADKSDNKNALVGIGISASLLPPFVNAGMLWAFITSDRIPLEYSFAYLGGISFALAWINIGMIVLVWGLGYCYRDTKEKEKKKKSEVEMMDMTNNPMRERTPLLF